MKFTIQQQVTVQFLYPFQPVRWNQPEKTGEYFLNFILRNPDTCIFDFNDKISSYVLIVRRCMVCINRKRNWNLPIFRVNLKAFESRLNIIFSILSLSK